MDGLGLGAVILAQRKRQGWTQEDLAARIGVSKGAVSKWETGQSYPDLPLVPRLAALFHITVDELLDYRPQLSREEIRRLHRELSREFAERPFPVACAHCRELAAQYASCAPLLLQLGSLFLNYLGLAGKPQPLLQEALALFSRAQEVSQDAYLCSEAKPIACCVWTALRRPSPAWGRIAAGQALRKPYRPWPIPAWDKRKKPGRCFKWASTMPLFCCLTIWETICSCVRERISPLPAAGPRGWFKRSQWNASTLDWCSPFICLWPKAG